jgi:hypothetical protein
MRRGAGRSYPTGNTLDAQDRRSQRRHGSTQGIARRPDDRRELARNARVVELQRGWVPIEQRYRLGSVSQFGQGRIAGLDACVVLIVAAGLLVVRSAGLTRSVFGKPLTRHVGGRARGTTTVGHYPPSKNHCGARDGAAETGETEEDYR